MKKSPINPYLKIALAIVMICSFSKVQSQVEGRKVTYTPSVYVGIGGGINEMGLLGFAAELPVSGKTSLGGSLGLGGWGYKTRINLNYYPKGMGIKSCWSLAYGRALGMRNFETELSTEPSNEAETLILDLKPAGTIDFVYSYNIKVGYSSRLVLSAGYAFSTNKNAYKVLDRTKELDQVSKSTLNILQPGGLMLGLKFMFGIG